MAVWKLGDRAPSSTVGVTPLTCVNTEINKTIEVPIRHTVLDIRPELGGVGLPSKMTASCQVRQRLEEEAEDDEESWPADLTYSWNHEERVG